ncbi:CAP domain-containing protein [Paracoccus sp. S-4012]|uniref:CAP domain-containing protein n=1 Tax=Paracoccus sp. S-4012 TaxID=2665648 RepID=UPI0018A21BD6|nr:CAP domain-containing protein [Paracoccus sp. S-4012]
MSARIAAALLMTASLAACAPGAFIKDTAAPGLDMRPLPDPSVETLATTCAPADPAVAASMLDAINAHRIAAGRTPVTEDPRLATAAQAHACDMQRTGRLSVVGSNGNSVLDRVRAVDYGPCRAAQTVAASGASPAALTAQWRGEAPNWDNIGSQAFENAGIGARQGPDGRVWWSVVTAARC